MIKVFIAHGPEQGRSFVLKSNTAQIGRALTNEVCLEEDSVSRKHAKVTKEKDLS